MSEAIDNPTVGEKKASSFLKVLCVLTYVGSGGGAVNSLISIAFGGNVEDQMAEAQTQMMQLYDAAASSPFVQDLVLAYVDMMDQLVENYMTMNLTALLAQLLNVAGAALMWKLKRNGYYIYLVGQLITIVMPMIFFGFNLIGGIMIASGAIFSILFLVLYGTQLKHMK